MENHEEGKKKTKKNQPTATYNECLFKKLCIDETTI